MGTVWQYRGRSKKADAWQDTSHEGCLVLEVQGLVLGLACVPLLSLKVFPPAQGTRGVAEVFQACSQGMASHKPRRDIKSLMQKPE